MTKCAHDWKYDSRAGYEWCRNCGATEGSSCDDRVAETPKKPASDEVPGEASGAGALRAALERIARNYETREGGLLFVSELARQALSANPVPVDASGVAK